MVEGLASEASGGSSLTPGRSLTVDERAERDRIIEALRVEGGNQTRAARRLGMSRSTLLTRLDSLGIPRPQKRQA